jgi:hypothetical protein
LGAMFETFIQLQMTGIMGPGLRRDA